MKLTNEIKRMLNALAHANAGDYLSPVQKRRALAGSPVPAVKPSAPTPAVARPRVGLYLGSELSADIMQYVVQTCSQLRHGLTALTFQSEEDAEALLSPYRPMLDAAGIDLRVFVVPGEAPAALGRALRRQPEVAFLICNEAGYLGHGLISGTQKKDALPVPLVLVAAKDDAAAQVGGTAENAETAAVRAA